MVPMKTVAFGLLLVFSAFSAQPQLPSTHSKKNNLVAKVYLSSSGTVHIVRRDGSDAEIPKQEGEVGRSEPIISDDRESVGWVVDYETGLLSSEPLPLELVIYRIRGPVLRFGGMPIWKWSFLAGGKQVAFYTNTLHGDLAPHFELRDIPTGRLLGKWNGPLDEKSPAWTDSLDNP
jgi:hypothetical protein